MPMHRKGIGSIVAILIILFIIFLVELVIFSQHVYHGEQQIRALSETELLSESSKLETWVRSYQKAAELGYVQSIFDSGHGSILLPYEFEWNYSSSYLPYWQTYDTPLDLCFKSESSEEYTIESSPSEFEDNNGWVNPSNAYALDDQNAYASPPSQTSYSVVFKGYSFDIPLEAKIEKVEVGASWYTSNPSYERLYAAVWDDTTWHEKMFPTQSSKNLEFLDFTSATSWDREKLNQNLKVRVRAYNSYVPSSGGGCYPNLTYVLTWNKTHYIFKSPEEIEEGELIVCYKNSIHFCEVIGKDEHLFEGSLLDIYVGSSHILLTENHPVLVPELGKVIEAKDLKPGVKIYYLKEGKVILLPIENITKVEFKGYVYDIKLNESDAIFFSKVKDDTIFSDLSSIEAIDLIIKVTVYLDWLPVRVTYKIEKKFKCPFEIFENYFKQKISLISLNYLKNYLKDYEDLSSKEYKMDFYGNVNPQIWEINESYILIKSSEVLKFKRSFEDTLGNEININRSTYLTSKIYTSFGKAIKKAIEILEKDFIGRCFRKEICDYSDENGLKSSLANLAKIFSEKDLNVSFELKNFASGIVEVKMEDNSSSYARYNFPKNSMNESFLGLDFLVRVGSTQSDQSAAKNLDIFRNCPNSNLGILALKSDICNYFQESLMSAGDEDEGDPYLKGKCRDSSGSYEDVCFDSMLYEYKPFSNPKVCYFEKIKCSECSDGRCKTSFCLDSDDLNYFNRGTVSYDGRGRNDECYSEDMVTEYYCSNGYVYFDRYECPQDCYCQNGACTLPDACKQLNDTISKNFGKTCYEEDYNPVADINKDGVVDILDAGNFGNNICNESWCSEMLSKTSNPCAICGNGVCDEGESQENCCMDCGCPAGFKCCPTGFCVSTSMPCPV